jgi:shikimate kinase
MADDVNKTIVLVGLMGAGKSAIGVRLADSLGLKFIDSDHLIEEKEKKSVSEIFAAQGEEYFRKRERETIAAIVEGATPCVLATGGGAFINDATRALIKKNAISVWLTAELDILVERVSRKNTRPILQRGDKAEIMARLMKERDPIYAQADVKVQSSDADHETVVAAVEKSIRGYVGK